MKASLKFREDHAPLFRAKLPFRIAGFPFLTGVAVGNTQDLTLHLGTFSKAGPCCKIAYKPTDIQNPCFLVLKSGFGLWGSPNNAPFSMTAKFSLSGKGDRLFSVHVKPKFGDFGFRKHVDVKHDSILGHGFTPSEKSSSDSSVPNIDAHFPLHKAGSLPIGNFDAMPSNSIRSSASDSNILMGSKGQEMSPTIGQEAKGIRGIVVDVRDDSTRREGQSKQNVFDFNGPEGSASTRWPFGFNGWRSLRWPLGFDGSFDDWRAIVHTSLPLRKYAKLNIRWGVEMPSDLFRSWGNMMSVFTSAKLPLLLMDKISIECPNPATNRELQRSLSSSELTHPWDYNLLPCGFSEDSWELAHVAAMCCSMKRRVQLLSTENKMLWREMEEMSDNFRYKGGWKPAKHGEILIQEDRISQPQLLNDLQSRNGKFSDLRRRNQWDLSRKDAAFESNGASSNNGLSSGASHSEASTKSKKAIRNSSSSLPGDRKD